ncbi:hypothetical protein DAPPUDRAFT_303738 [Daphnia pulex]|uniref:Sulfatase N-terminal domain-containing protein n=1 Tax=Daphnia pulex TaxID=6669 RepID=E9GHQ4_DAPPU|nr:hypothetical protein DAPPUDRAFT_303738 [Daphnia pulex]|eukprot:EFX81012.1 hypothetical protein DAPPUDRAFT_303738 [Daphnia pulex]
MAYLHIVALSVLVSSSWASGKQIQQPNLIFILADDFGWNDVSFHGSKQIPTPNLDALAFSGLILQNYYVTPLCTPSRSALMTGKHPIHTGMQHDVLYGYSRYGLPLSEITLPEYLKDLGYKNHIVGKWHLGHYKSVYTPLFRGFDSHYGYWTGHQDYYDHTAVEWNAWGYDMRRNHSVDWSAYGKYTTTLLTDEACDVITKHDVSSPLFLYVAHLAVHSANPYSPLQAPEETVEMFSSIENLQRRRYAAMVHELDVSVGKIVKSLGDNNMLENTVIVFSTDNGGPAEGFNQNAASNWPLKGVKNTPWEGGVRAAGLIWSPLIPKSRRGQVMSNLMDISDWLPTLFEAAGQSRICGDVATLKGLDGVSHWNTVLYDKPSARNHVLHNIDDQLGYAAIRKENWKLVKGTTYEGSWDGWYGPSGRTNESSTNFINSVDDVSLIYKNAVLDSDAAQYIAMLGMSATQNLYQQLLDAEISCGERPVDAHPCLPLDALCLFDIEQDPCEYNNLAEKMPHITEDLLSLLSWYNSTAVAPLNTSPDPMSNPKYWNYTYTNWADFV